MLELFEEVLEFLWFGAMLGAHLVPGPVVGMGQTSCQQVKGQPEGDVALRRFLLGWEV